MVIRSVRWMCRLSLFILTSPRNGLLEEMCTINLLDWFVLQGFLPKLSSMLYFYCIDDYFTIGCFITNLDSIFKD